ncbi:terminase protein [Altererythrobacter epoxidivorans]|uniref:Terminase protein n=1 Tax=Altererythrobacter epoxidivorans TaxID=361183 RepID=A0A0M5KZ69_9SPHN|nr:terminase protein [Altererythrobacter epoxidivorans]
MDPDQRDWLAEASEKHLQRLTDWLSESEKAAFGYHWPFFARPEQLPPAGNWRYWLVMAGRGFGKTRTGAEWVRTIAEHDPAARIALVSGSLAEARAVMVEGESGILACCAPESMPVFEPSLRRLRFPSGAQAFLYSAAEPDSLRGPQHSHAWCDEIGKWPIGHERATQSWDNLLLGLRLGERQQVVATTTPRHVALVRRLLDARLAESTVVTTGATYENTANLPRTFIEAVEAEFGNSQLARQELHGELVADIEGALWNRALLERCRITDPAADPVRIVVAVDPPASSKGDACGIVVAALGADGNASLLADCSIENASPERWARAVANASDRWNADRIVAEANQGGDMVASVLRAADIALPVRLVHASRGKVARAEPVAALYEAGRVRHCGPFPQLEDQLCGLMAGGTYEGPGRSPDRADALVWALTELMLGRRGGPRVRTV